MREAVEILAKLFCERAAGGVCGGQKPPARSIKQDFETFYSFKIRTSVAKRLFRHADAFQFPQMGTDSYAHQSSGQWESCSSRLALDKSPTACSTAPTF